MYNIIRYTIHLWRNIIIYIVKYISKESIEYILHDKQYDIHAWRIKSKKMSAI